MAVNFTEEFWGAINYGDVTFEPKYNHSADKERFALSLPLNYVLKHGIFIYQSGVMAAMCQDTHSATVVLPDGATVNPQSESGKSVGLVKVLNLLKEETCLNFENNLRNQSYQMIERVDNCAPCNSNVDIEKGIAEIPNSSEESIDSLKSDDSTAWALQRVIWLQLTRIFMYLFMHQGSDLPKVASKDRVLAERGYDTPTNRSRKYKRSPSFNSSFNSRRVVLLFSVMSSMGTIILIYLTLRVRQISEGSGTI